MPSLIKLAFRTHVACLVLGLGLVFAAVSGAVEVHVRSLNSIDISAFRSCSWREGRPAPDHQVEQAIREAVEEKLQGAGYSVVDDGGDCLIASHAVGDANFPVGVLMVEIHEATSGQIAWRGEANGLVEGSPKERMKLARKVIKRMFKHFPRSAAD